MCLIINGLENCRNLLYLAMFERVNRKLSCRRARVMHCTTEYFTKSLKCHSKWYRYRVNPTRLSSPKSKGSKGKNVTKNFKIYIAPWRPNIQRHSEDRELNQARSKPNPVDQLLRTARTNVHHYNGIKCCSTETVLLLHCLHTNITSQMWTSGGEGNTRK